MRDVATKSTSIKESFTSKPVVPTVVRLRYFEEFFPHFVEGSKILQISHEHLRSRLECLLLTDLIDP